MDAQTSTAQGQIAKRQPGFGSAIQPVQQTRPAAAISSYEGTKVLSIQLPAIPEADRDRLARLLPQNAGQPLERDLVRESIRILFATGRFADIQAEAVPSGNGVVLTFTTSPNYFVGAIAVEGAPARPNTNQVINASKF